jgi:23S rRNA pseudouridine2604 synthase
MEKGVLLEDGYKTKPCQLRKIDNTHFYIILTEGKKRQIRRMCATFNYHVEDLKRVRIENIHLGKLGLGEIRKIQGQELQKFLEIINL